MHPSLDWLFTTATPKRLAAEMARTQDPDQLGALTERCQVRPVGESATGVALHRIAVLLATKGGVIADITAGDCVELLHVAAKICAIPHYRSPYFYQLLLCGERFWRRGHADGQLGLTAQRQLSVKQLIDRCGLELPGGPRPARRLSAGAADQHRPRQPGSARRHPRPPVLEGPGNPPPGHRLPAAPAPGHRSVETANLHQNNPPHSARRQRRRDAQLTGKRHQLPLRGAHLLPRHRPVGNRRPGSRWARSAVPCPISKTARSPTGGWRCGASRASTSGPGNGCRYSPPWSPRSNTQRTAAAPTARCHPRPPKPGEVFTVGELALRRSAPLAA